MVRLSTDNTTHASISFVSRNAVLAELTVTIFHPLQVCAQRLPTVFITCVEPLRLIVVFLGSRALTIVVQYTPSRAGSLSFDGLLGRKACIIDDKTSWNGSTRLTLSGTTAVAASIPVAASCDADSLRVQWTDSRVSRNSELRGLGSTKLEN